MSVSFSVAPMKNWENQANFASGIKSNTSEVGFRKIQCDEIWSKGKGKDRSHALHMEDLNQLSYSAGPALTCDTTQSRLHEISNSLCNCNWHE